MDLEEEVEDGYNHSSDSVVGEGIRALGNDDFVPEERDGGSGTSLHGVLGHEAPPVAPDGSLRYLAV